MPRVGILAATILLIATNAGLIGAKGCPPTKTVEKIVVPVTMREDIG